jgi:hypothetical protein
MPHSRQVLYAACIPVPLFRNLGSALGAGINSSERSRGTQSCYLRPRRDRHCPAQPGQPACRPRHSPLFRACTSFDRYRPRTRVQYASNGALSTSRLRLAQRWPRAAWGRGHRGCVCAHRSGPKGNFSWHHSLLNGACTAGPELADLVQISWATSPRSRAVWAAPALQAPASALARRTSAHGSVAGDLLSLRPSTTRIARQHSSSTLTPSYAP